MKEHHVAKKQAMYVRIVVRTAAVAGQRKDHVTSTGVNEYCAEVGRDEELEEEGGESAARVQVEDREAFRTFFRGHNGVAQFLLSILAGLAPLSFFTLVPICTCAMHRLR